LRRPDPTAAGLGIPLPSDAERFNMLTDLERSPGFPQFSTENVTLDESRLIKISSHHVLTTLTPFYRPMFERDVIAITGAPEIARCIVEGIDPRVRQNSISGVWHSLNVSLVYTLTFHRITHLDWTPTVRDNESVLGKNHFESTG
jgi:hypothetical protein